MAITQTITPLPAAPDPSMSEEDFDAHATEFTAALPPLATEINAIVPQINSTATDITTKHSDVVIKHDAVMTTAQQMQINSTALQNAVNSASGSATNAASSASNAAASKDAAAASATTAAAPGVIIFYPKYTPPAGYLKANGAAVSRTSYSALFAVLGTVFGAGDGSTTFNVPDLRAEFIRGLDDGRGVDYGRVIGTIQGSGILAHVHDIISSPHAGSSQYPPLQVAGNTGYPSNGLGADSMVFSFNEGRRNILFGQLITASTGDTETKPRNVALLACISY